MPLWVQRHCQMALITSLIGSDYAYRSGTDEYKILSTESKSLLCANHLVTRVVLTHESQL